MQFILWHRICYNFYSMMKRNVIVLLVATLSLFCYNLSYGQMGYADETRIIMKVKKGFDIAHPDITEKHRLFDAESIEPMFPNSGSALRDIYILNFVKVSNAVSIVETYESTGLFEYVEVDRIGKAGGTSATVPNDTMYGWQWYGNNDASFSLAPATVDADIDLEEAWDVETGSSSTILAILDSGTKLDHNELNDRLWINPNEDALNSLDDDGNGLVNDINGWDFVNNDNDPIDDHGHGTNIAGLIAAESDNTTGYAGVDWNCRVMTCKILDDNGTGFYSWWADALVYATDQGADVINMSVGGSDYSAFLEDAVNYAHDNGVVVIACMMNGNELSPFYPAAFTNSIAVGSTDPNDERSAPFDWSTNSGSNFGNHIDIVAPGAFMLGLSHADNTDFSTYWSGTSQASAITAGVACLIKAQSPGISPEDIRNTLAHSAEDQVGKPSEDIAGWDRYHGSGRLNAYNALVFPVGEEELTYNSEFTMEAYPNPASSAIQLKISVNSDAIVNVFIHDNLGRLVYQNQPMVEELQGYRIDVSKLMPGVYTISAESQHEVLAEKLIVR